MPVNRMDIILLWGHRTNTHHFFEVVLNNIKRHPVLCGFLQCIFFLNLKVHKDVDNEVTLVGETGLPGAKRSTGGDSAGVPPNKTSSSSKSILLLLRGFLVYNK